MTKLEQEIAERLFENFKKDLLEQSFEHMSIESFEDDAKAAADVAKKYIERAWNCSKGFAESKHPDAPSLSEWAKENGITE